MTTYSHTHTYTSLNHRQAVAHHTTYKYTMLKWCEWWWFLIIFVSIGVTTTTISTTTTSNNNNNNNDIDDDFTQLLHWAPLVIKTTPFVTFINDFVRPSWRTRHPITKYSEPLLHLRLPRNVPFSLVCGACFRKSSSTSGKIYAPAANLTVKISSNQSYVSLPKTKTSSSYYDKNNTRNGEYSVAGNLICMMTYFITLPFVDETGVITCTLDRGIRHRLVKETVSYKMMNEKIKIMTTTKRIIINDNSNSNENGRQKQQQQQQQQQPIIQLKCPPPPTNFNFTKEHPPVYVWYNQDFPLEAPILNTGMFIKFRRPIYADHRITCSVYQFVNSDSGFTPIKQYNYLIQASSSADLRKRWNQIWWEDNILTKSENNNNNDICDSLDIISLDDPDSSNVFYMNKNKSSSPSSAAAAAAVSSLSLPYNVTTMLMKIIMKQQQKTFTIILIITVITFLISLLIDWK